jgi:hypothetical protein
MTETIARSPTERTALFAAILATVTTLTLNVSSAFSSTYVSGDMHSLLNAIAFSVGAISATIAACALPSIIIASFGRRQVAQGLAATILWPAAVVLSMLSALSASSVTRSDATASRQAASSTAARLLADHKRLTADLDATAIARSSAELKPLAALAIAATHRADCAKTVSSQSIRAACSTARNLQAELARFQRRHELQDQLAAIDSKLNAGQSTKAADPLAAAIATYAGAIGISTTADKVALLLPLVAPLFFELMSALGFVAAGFGTQSSTRSSANVRPLVNGDRHSQEVLTQQPLNQFNNSLMTAMKTTPKPTSELTAASVQNADATAHATATETTPAIPAVVNLSANTTPLTVAQTTATTPASLQDRLVAEIAANGGEIKTTQRGLARMLNVDPGNLNRAVHTLVAAGVIAASIGRSGTSLSLAA